MNILLHPTDTKAKRAESFRVPEQLLPYLLRYLKEMLAGFRRFWLRIAKLGELPSEVTPHAWSKTTRIYAGSSSRRASRAYNREAFRAAYAPGDVFDGTAGCGVQLSEGTREWVKFVYRRWLGFLKATYPDDLSKPPADRITPERVRAFIDHLSANMRPNSVAIVANHLYTAARLIAPKADWAWLRSLNNPRL